MGHTLIGDLRFALRMLSRHPLHASTVIATLGVGIALCGTAAVLGTAVLISPLPYPAAERISVVHLNNPARNLTRFVLSNEELRDFRELSTAQGRTAGFITWTAVLSGAGAPQRIRLNIVSPEYFDVLGLRVARGRRFIAADDHGEAGTVAVLSWGYWQREFGGADVLGKVVRLDDKPFTIIGVADATVVDITPAGAETDVWVPLSAAPQFLPANVLTERRMRVVGVVALRREDVSADAARDDAERIARLWQTERADTNEGLSLTVTPLAAHLLGNIRPQVLTLGAAALVVLLIGCVNIVNLMLMRGTARQQEMTLRSSLGAGRGRLFRQLVTESAVLSAIGAAFGWMLAPLLTTQLMTLSPVRLPPFVTVDGRHDILVLVAAMGLMAGILCALVPAWHLSRSADALTLSVDPRGATAGRSRRRLQHVLVTTEVALSMLLLVGAASTLKTFRELLAIDPGYRAESALTVRVNLGGATFDAEHDRIRYAFAALDELRQVPGVVSADVWAPNMPGAATLMSSVVAEGQPRASQDQWTVTRRHHVSPDALQHLGIRLIAGRGITSEDREGSRLVAVISESLARALWPGEGAIGKRLFGQQANTPVDQAPLFEVVGVVGDVKHFGRSRPAATDGGRDIYYAFRQVSRRELAFVIRAAGDAEALSGEARKVLVNVNSTLVPYDWSTLEARMARDESRSRFAAFVIVSFGTLALVLAGIGTYGVLGYAVLERTSEIGVRMALGADRISVLIATLRSGLSLVAAGLIAGAAASLAVAPVVRAWTTVLGAVDAPAVAIAGAVVIVVGGIAALVPAHRASRIDPLVAIRRS